MKISESDWKKFKKLRPVALERFTRQVLDESLAICRDDSRTAHERYLALYELMHERDRELERIFDYLRRSTALVCLLSMHSSGLISDEEMSEFSADVRQLLEFK